MPKCPDSVNSISRHMIAVIHREFGYRQFMACELMQHLDSSIFGADLLWNIQNSTNILIKRGNKWKLNGDRKKALPK